MTVTKITAELSVESYKDGAILKRKCADGSTRSFILTIDELKKLRESKTP